MVSKFLFVTLVAQLMVMPCDASPYNRDYIFGLRGRLEFERENKKEVTNVKSVATPAAVTTTNSDVLRDYEEAEDALFHAVERVEKEFIKAVEGEVDTLFHKSSHIQPPMNCSNKSTKITKQVSSPLKSHRTNPKVNLDDIHRSIDRDLYIKSLATGFQFV